MFWGRLQDFSLHLKKHKIPEYNFLTWRTAKSHNLDEKTGTVSVTWASSNSRFVVGPAAIQIEAYTLPFGHMS